MIERKKRCNKKVRRDRKEYARGFSAGCEARKPQGNEQRPTQGPYADGARDGLEVWIERDNRRKILKAIDDDFSAGKIAAWQRNAAYGTPSELSRMAMAR